MKKHAFCHNHSPVFQLDVRCRDTNIYFSIGFMPAGKYVLYSIFVVLYCSIYSIFAYLLLSSLSGAVLICHRVSTAAGARTVMTQP